MNEFNGDALQRLDVAVALVNAWRQGELERRPGAVFQDHGYRAPATRAEWAAVVRMAERLSAVLASIADRDDSAAIASINARLRSLSVTPQIEQREGRRLLHFHAAEVPFADGWEAGITAALAIAYSTDDADRIGTCSAPGCRRHYLDRGRNKQRRFCGIQCQNRVKSTAYRRRRVDG